MKAFAVMAAGAGLLLPAADGDPNKKDLDKLQRTWKLERADRPGVRRGR
jgi:hypothetical protein